MKKNQPPGVIKLLAADSLFGSGCLSECLLYPCSVKCVRRLRARRREQAVLELCHKDAPLAAGEGVGRDEPLALTTLCDGRGLAHEPDDFACAQAVLEIGGRGAYT